MDFDVLGKLGSLDIPAAKALQPLFEAVVNSIQAIEMAGRSGPGKIQIIIQRERLLDGLDERGRIDGFVVVDDGIGFNDENLGSFFTAYSRHKLKLGGKGLGRFTFLKMFGRTEIDSHFVQDGAFVYRLFSLPEVLQKPEDPPETSSASKHRTSVELCEFREPWRSACEDRAEVIALNLIAHCIPYFLNPACPKIELIDDSELIDLNEFFRKNFQQQAKAQEFDIQGHKFRLTGFRLWHNRAESKHRLIYAANYREVKSETLTKYLPSIGEHHLDGDDGKKFVYVGFVEGNYLNEHTNPERLRFNIPSGDDDDSPLLPGMPTFAAIRNGAVEAAKIDLAPYLAHIAEQVEQKVLRFVKVRAPELRSMLRYLPKFIHEIPADATDARINDILRHHQFQEEQVIKKDGTKLFKELKKQGLRPPDYESRLNDWLEKSNELGKSALARYVLHRKVMLQFLEESLRKDKTTGKYKLEEVVHRIIYPMQATSDQVSYDQQNLWMIDERLAFHEFLTSDRRLDKTEELDSASKMRPDLLVFQPALSFKQDPEILQSVVIVEFKQPGRDDYDAKDNPIEQAFKLIDRIRTGKAEKDGRTIRVQSDLIPAWAYIVCDLTKTLKETARWRGLLDTVDGEGKYQYFPELRIYVEIVSYDKLLSDAKKRNRVLFESLNLPT